MSYFLFIDESGHDRVRSPYEVLAGIAIEDRDLWNLISQLHEAEVRNFGVRYSDGPRELKGQKLLKSKVFHHAALNAEVSADERTGLARRALTDGADAGVREWKALAEAKLNYVREVFELCGRYRCKAFASIVETDAPRSESDFLRKDYAYLFERFFYFLEDIGRSTTGVIVFDELEKSKSHLLVDQAHRYFRDTWVGRTRASQILPEPFFVHSDLTTGVQIADLIAYTVSWGFRLPNMTKPARRELAPFADQVAGLRHRCSREKDGIQDFVIWSFAHIDDLRAQFERDGEE